jgi:hypothetical protein
MIASALGKTRRGGYHILAAFDDGPHDLSAHPGLPQAWRSMCGCTLNGIFAAFPSFVIILRKPTALMGAPRSLKNR